MTRAYRWLRRDVGRRLLERPVILVVAVAVVARLAVIAAVLAEGPEIVVPDEQAYIVLATHVADGGNPSALWNGYGASLWHSTFAYTAPLSALYWLFEPSRLLGMLLAAAFGAVTAGLTAWLVLLTGSKEAAAAAGLVVALLPSQLFWSSVVLRESMVWASLALLAVATSLAAARRPVLGLVLATAALTSLAFLRTQTLIAACAAFLLATLVISGQRLQRAAGAAALVLFVPALAGAGIAGHQLVTAAAPALSTTRSALAEGAASRLVPEESAQEPVDGAYRSGRATGALEIARRNRAAADARPTEPEDEVHSNVAALPRGVAGFVLRPFPWEGARNVEVKLARAENVLWYALYAAAAPSLLVLSRHRRVLGYPVLLTVALVAMNALTQGNVGTAFRHRGQLAWALAVLAVVGIAATASARAHRAETVPGSVEATART